MLSTIGKPKEYTLVTVMATQPDNESNFYAYFKDQEESPLSLERAGRGKTENEAIQNLFALLSPKISPC
jgi:hypothetical protein